METTFTSSPERRPRLQNRGIFPAIRSVLETVVIVVVLFSLVNLVTARYVVDGASMQPNFHTGQYLIVSRANYLFGDLQRGDIVVFHYPYQQTEDYIKRLIGLPGDVIEIRDTLVYVNGEMLNEPYINEPCDRNHCPDESWEVGENQYFLMGDNRNHSTDSRSFGVVDRQFIVGEAVFRYFPLQDIGVVLHTGLP